MSDIIFIDVVLTCETPGCENEQIAITTQMAEDGVAICGPCKQTITNIETAPDVVA